MSVTHSIQIMLFDYAHIDSYRGPTQERVALGLISTVKDGVDVVASQLVAFKGEGKHHVWSRFHGSWSITSFRGCGRLVLTFHCRGDEWRCVRYYMNADNHGRGRVYRGCTGNAQITLNLKSTMTCVFAVTHVAVADVEDADWNLIWC